MTSKIANTLYLQRRQIEAQIDMSLAPADNSISIEMELKNITSLLQEAKKKHDND